MGKQLFYDLCQAYYNESNCKKEIWYCPFSVSNITTNYLYDGLNAIIEKNEAGVTRAFYNRGLSYGGGIGGIISACRNGVPTYYHYDGIGAVTGLTDPNGKLLQSYSYDAFGNALMAQGQGKGAKNITNPYGFSTKEYNPKSGLSYFGARYYDPAVGRFMTKDPLAGLIEEPVNLHRYAYVGNNPVSRIDPLGLMYVDVNIGYGFVFRAGYIPIPIGVTGGVMIDIPDDADLEKIKRELAEIKTFAELKKYLDERGSGYYPYLGGGIMTPKLSGTVTWSPMNPTQGWNVGFQGSSWTAKQIGFAPGKEGSIYIELGSGNPSASATIFHVWKWDKA